MRIIASDSANVKFWTNDGAPINGVGGYAISGAPDQITTATIQLEADKVDIHARPLLGRETLEWSADALGLKLIPKGNPEDPVLHAISKRLERIEAILLQQQQLSQQAVDRVVGILRG